MRHSENNNKRSKNIDNYETNGFNYAKDTDQQQNAVLNGINRIFREAITCSTYEELGVLCLNVVEELTQSKFGFIGEVSPEGESNDIAISTTGWDACKMDNSTGHKRAIIGFKVHGIYGQVLLDGKPIITNNPAVHPNSIGVPKGHPELNAFLGVPLKENEKTIGMIGLGNREGGYTTRELQIVEVVSPAIVQAFKHKKAEEALKQNEQQIKQQNENLKTAMENVIEKDKEIRRQKDQFEAVIENMHDALAIYGNEGKIIFLNAEARKLYPHLDTQATIDNAHEGFEYFDLDNNIIIKENLPSRRVLKGEKIRNERIFIKRNGKNHHIEINATPIFDDVNNLVSSVVTHHDISEMIRNQQEIKNQQEQLLKTEQAKNEALETSMKVKDDFLYLITHEFKTPMAVISSALQAIDFICKDDMTERLCRFLNTIKMNTNRQLRLVNNLLDITRISSGHIKLKRSSFDIVYVTKAIVDSVEVYAKQKQVILNFTTRITRKEIYLDEEKFERIMLNLLSNALKFTPQGKAINVLLSVKKHKKQNFISVSVKDKGIGIPIDRQKIIFERFGQADTSLSRQAEGTGLGLHLVTLLVNALEGEIFLESEAGKGSTFTVLFPAINPVALDEGAACREVYNQFISNDNRIVQAVSIEFSDIYLN